MALSAALLASMAAVAATVPVPAHVAEPVRPTSAPASAAPASTAATSATTLPIADTCPAQLPVKQTISEPIDGWTPLDQQGSHQFVRVAFYPGPPAETKLIVPTIEFQRAAGLHDGWDLPARPGGYWMTCAYANTTASVARQLPASVDFCQADYDRHFVMLVVRRWSCGLRRTMLPPTGAKATTRPTPKSAPKSPYKQGS